MVASPSELPNGCDPRGGVLGEPGVVVPGAKPKLEPTECDAKGVEGGWEGDATVPGVEVTSLCELGILPGVVGAGVYPGVVDADVYREVGGGDARVGAGVCRGTGGGEEARAGSGLIIMPDVVGAGVCRGTGRGDDAKAGSGLTRACE